MYIYVYQSNYKNVHRSPIVNSQKPDGQFLAIKNKLLHNLYKPHKHNTKQK